MMNNWWEAVPSSPYGNDAGWFGNYHDIERGNVYSMTENTPLNLPTAATYDPRYSTQYSAVYETADGHALNFMHISNLLYGTKVATPEPAGYQFATDPHLPANYTGTTVDGKSFNFDEVDAPGTGVVEFGIFDTPAHAFAHNSGGSLPPSAWGPILAGTGATASSGANGGRTAGPAPSTPVADWTDPFAHGPGSILDWGKGNPLTDISLQPGGLAGQQVNKTVSNAVSGPASLLAMAGAMAARLGLVALFGAAAIGVLVLMFKSLLIPKV